MVRRWLECSFTCEPKQLWSYYEVHVDDPEKLKVGRMMEESTSYAVFFCCLCPNLM